MNSYEILLFPLFFGLLIINAANTSTEDAELNSGEDNNENITSPIVSDAQNITANTITYENNTIQNETVSLDIVTSSLKNDTKKVAKCNMVSLSDEERYLQTVEMVNASRLAKLLVIEGAVTDKDTEGDCMAVLFFARVCQFSCQAAPHFNALARAFPSVKMVAMDALKYHGINAQNGIVGVPTLKLFHNGRPIGKFNGTEYTLEAFTKFIKTYTNLNEEFSMLVPKDFDGPVPSVIEKELDYFLVMSWLFIIVCGVYFFGKSSWWKTIVETVQNNWRESEAQHEHVD